MNVNTQKEIITVRKLKEHFGFNYPYAVDLEIVKQLPRASKKEHRKYELLLDVLPSKEEFIKMLNNKYSISISSLLSDAFEEIESLKDELNDWYDNLGDNLQQTEKGQMLEEAVSTLDYAERVELDSFFDGEILEEIESIKTVYVPAHWSNNLSRASRRDEATGMLNVVMEKLQELVDDEKYDEEIIDSINDAISEIENAISEVESVEFPSMY